MPTLLAADLDRTLIYSLRSAAYDGAASELVGVEQLGNSAMSYMLRTAADQLATLSGLHVFVPVTTRTTDHFHRVAIPRVRHRFAITANGGEILVDGRPCPVWGRDVASRLAEHPPAPEVRRRLADLLEQSWVGSLRNPHGMFLCAVLDLESTPGSFVTEVADRMRDSGWRVLLQARKLYVVPNGLTKDAAVAEIVRRTGADRVLAAGDSSLDVGMLALADRAIYPSHGYLAPAELAALAPDITLSSGVRAGAEIINWFAARSTDADAPPRPSTRSDPA